MVDQASKTRMVKVTIDGKTVEVEENTTILKAARKANVSIPTLCYLEGLNDIGACRVCCVEVEGKNQLAAACNNRVTDGMVVHTNSPKARWARKTNVQLILSQHNVSCTSCVRGGNCELQTVARELGISEEPFPRNYPLNRSQDSYPLVRHDDKCIKCMRCIQVCDKVQQVSVWDLVNNASHTNVGVKGGGTIVESDCTLCGQCVTHCPVGALRAYDETDRFFEAIADKKKTVVVQIAPAVRAAWGESLGLPREKATVKRLVAALRKMGVDYIFDTSYTADLTIMEEGTEFLQRLTARANGDDVAMPMFTSCCPGWVRFLKSQYPDMVEHLSTAKSPQQMFGAVVKSYLPQVMGIDPASIVSVSIMPCVAKKAESRLSTMNDAGYGQDVDIVLTTREVDRMISSQYMVVNELDEEEFDSPFDDASGAGVIFGATGGVMEAALRSAYYLVTGSNPDPDAFENVRSVGRVGGAEGDDGVHAEGGARWKEATFDVAGTPVRVAVASSLGNARALVEAVRAGEVDYDFIEIMACPGGCAGGGGQPISTGEELAGVRGEVLYGLDKVNDLRFSHENPAIKRTYEEFLGEPCGEKSHHLLHTDHTGWHMPHELERLAECAGNGDDGDD